MAAIAGCCAFGMIAGDKNGKKGADVAAASADVDLEALAKAYKRHIKSGAQDLNAFEKEVNAKKIYKGKGTVSTTFDSKGQVVGYINKDGKPGYTEKADELIFTLNADQKQKRIVASDRYRRHYGLRASDVFTLYLFSRMLSTQRTFYGGRYWAAPRTGRWVQPGYYNRVRSRSVRSGSRSRYGRSGRSGSRSGGFGFGK